MNDEEIAVMLLDMAADDGIRNPPSTTDPVVIAKWLVEEHSWDSLDMVEATMPITDDEVLNSFFDRLGATL